MSGCDQHDWQGRPDVSSATTQRYRCVRCGAWGWRMFRPLTPIKEYPPGRTYDAQITVRSTATTRGAVLNRDDSDDDEPRQPPSRQRK